MRETRNPSTPLLARGSHTPQTHSQPPRVAHRRPDTSAYLKAKGGSGPGPGKKGRRGKTRRARNLAQTTQLLHGFLLVLLHSPILHEAWNLLSTLLLRPPSYGAVVVAVAGVAAEEERYITERNVLCFC